MSVYKQLNFGPFRLDEANECLLNDSRTIPLRPKAYSVLKYLVARPGTLVTKQQLLDDVWPDTFVSDAVLKDIIKQLREVLGDDAKSPQFIETAHRRGYRFICQVTTGSTAISDAQVVQPNQRFTPYPPFVSPSATVSVLGRESALEQMRTWMKLALAADRQVVFVTGEAGIGKTALVEAFLEQVAAIHNLLIARGEWLEQYCASEAYLPVLDALSRLARESGGAAILACLRQYAPTWLIQMPALSTATDREALPQQVLGATRERMLREMAEAIEALTLEAPLLLVLEDLHWSDYSTLDLVSYLARRTHPARLLLLGTYRPVDVILSEHPLKGVKQELQMHRLCEELPLEYLSQEAVVGFLKVKFPAHRFPERLAEMVHQRTEGNLLFMVNVIDYLLEEKIVVKQAGLWQIQVDLEEVELGVRENIRFLIEKHIDRLTEVEQRVLEGASVVGMDCSAVAMSAGLAEDVIMIEEVCDSLARRHQFLLPAYLAELPDGTITPRYRFMHALYLDVLYKRVAVTSRSQIHGRIGERGEAIYGDRVC